MINFEKYELDNGLTVLLKQDFSTSMVAVNILYKVGARDEDPEATGLAHLFEHLMFEGSANIPSYDEPLQKAGGSNNAFTNNDYTNYYLTVPSQNLEIGLWLESDRMLNLAFSEEKLDIQRKVVMEEYKERYLNKPYGDLWLEFRPLCYKVHPYQWPTIGKKLEHIENVTLQQVKDFFTQYYHPANAILCMAGNFELNKAKALIDKWFSDIPAQKITPRNLPKEPIQTQSRKLILERDVPQKMVMIAYPMSNRLSKEYYVADIISEIAGNGKSSRFYTKFVKELKVFSEVSSFVTGSLDEGLLCFYARVNDSVTLETAEGMIKEEIKKFTLEKVKENELTTMKNRYELGERLERMGYLNIAMQLCYFEMLGDANKVNEEMNNYNKVTANDILTWAQENLLDERSNVLYYEKIN